MYGALVNVDGETWLAGANVSHLIVTEYVFYYNNQKITKNQYEAILSKYYDNGTRADLGSLAEEAEEKRKQYMENQ